MFSYNVAQQPARQQQPVVYVLVQGQPGQTAPAPLSAQSLLGAQTVSHLPAGLSAAAASPLSLHAATPSHEAAAVAALSQEGHHRLSREEILASIRPPLASRRPETLGSSSTGTTATRTTVAYPPRGSSSAATGVQVLSIPQYAPAPAPVAFPPPGSTVQMIQRVPAETLVAQQELLQRAAAGAPSSSLLGATAKPAKRIHPQAHLLNPAIRFVSTRAGVPIPPQGVPTYQLVPAGYQVVPVSRVGQKPARKAATAQPRIAAEQQELDVNVDEAQLLREPIVLSGQPYPYAVRVGKDVVSGKGGRAQQYNKHFRKLITDAFPRYSATQSKIEKREIGIRIYLTIVKAGGRFLDAQGNPMNRSKAILKTMKALKDAKTWANDIKRLAVQNRKKKKHMEALRAERGGQDHFAGDEEESRGSHDREVAAKVMADDDGFDEDMEDNDDDGDDDASSSVSEEDEDLLAHEKQPTKVPLSPTQPETSTEPHADNAQTIPTSPDVGPVPDQDETS